MASNEIVYRAKRLRVLLLTVLGVGMAAACFYDPFLADLRTGNFHAPGSGLLRLLNPDERVGLFHIFGAFFGFLSLCIARLLLNSRVMTIDDEGIAVHTFYGTRRALWGNVATIGLRQVRSVQFVVLKFNRPAGADAPRFPVTSLTLPLKIIGVTKEAVLAEIELRISRLRHRSPNAFSHQVERQPAPLRELMSPGAPPSFGRRGVTR